MELIFDKYNAYLFTDEPFNIKEYIYNIESSYYIRELIKLSTLKIGKYCPYSEVIVAPEFVWEALTDEGYEDLEVEFNLLCMINKDKEKILETKQKLDAMEKSRNQYKDYIRNNNVFLEYHKKPSRNTSVSRSFECYTYLNNTVYIVIKEQSSQCLDKRGIHRLVTDYVLHDAKSLDVFLAHTKSIYTDYD